MGQYLINRYKGIYRLKSAYDLKTNEYPRDENGNIETDNVYIDCKNNVQIYHYGGKTLVCLIPSIGRGRNIIKALTEMGKADIISDVMESDNEIWFKFEVSNMETIASLVKPKTNGASISPFSTRNLPSSKDKLKPNKYEVPTEQKEQYKEMITLLKEWVSKSGLQLGAGYQKFNVEFGKAVKIDLVKESIDTNYKVVNLICQKNLISNAIKFLQG